MHCIALRSMTFAPLLSMSLIPNAHLTSKSPTASQLSIPSQLSNASMLILIMAAITSRSPMASMADRI